VAGGGIGKELLPDKLAQEGANVVLTDIARRSIKRAVDTYKPDI